MKKIWLFFIILFCVSFSVQAQSSEGFGLLRFKIPAGWQQQLRTEWASYIGTEPETGKPVEIIVHQPQAATPKPDSSFRMEWRRIFNEKYAQPAVPVVRKRFSPNSIPYTENGSEMSRGSEKLYSHLFVFTINNQVAAVQIITDKISSYKALRLFTDEFLESVTAPSIKTD